MKLRTKEVESDKFQNQPIDLYIYYNPIVSLILNENQSELFETFITSIDINQITAENEFRLFFKSDIETQQNMYEMHKMKFQKLWDEGRIELDNIELQIKFDSSYYYLLSSLPVKKSFSNLNDYYGLSSSGLSRGSINKDKQGHLLWDSEIWIFPTILLFHPDLAKIMLSYRIKTGQVAEYNANFSNQSGWRFGRETAYTGIDVTDNGNEKKKNHQIHITGDIAFVGKY